MVQSQIFIPYATAFIEFDSSQLASDMSTAVQFGTLPQKYRTLSYLFSLILSLFPGGRGRDGI